MRSSARITASTYDPTGACIAIPGQTAIPPSARVRSFPVVERYHWIWIWMGDPALADPDTIEDFHWMDDPDWRFAGERIELKGQLCPAGREFARPLASFLHPSNNARHRQDRAHADEGRASRSRRPRHALDHGEPAAALLPEGGGFTQDQSVDRWQIIEWTPAAFVRLDVGCAIAGTGAREGDRSRGITMRNLNAITPETERTTHYFWAQAHNFGIEKKWLTDLIFQNVHTAFLEDLAIIGAQQENIDTRPDAPRIDMNHDTGGIAARRMLEAMIAAEPADATSLPRAMRG